MDYQHDQTLRELIQALLVEPFAQRHRFHEKSLLSICQEIELSFNSLDAQTESYQKSRDSVCLILSYLELLGHTEMPEGNVSALIDQKTTGAPTSASPFLDAAEFFRALKLSGETKLSALHLDRLIGQQLCLEVEKQANEILNQTKTRHFSLDQLGAVAQALGLDPKLSEYLFYFEEKKRESLSLQAVVSPEWLSQLEKNFSAALEYLNQSLASDLRQGKAA